MRNSITPSAFEAVKHLNILHIEEERIIRDNLSNCFGHVFNEILSAQNGLEALEFFHDNTIDIVITDMVLQKISALDVLRQIKQVSPHTPCIVTISDTSKNNIMDLIELNIHHILTKPYDLNCLFSKILHIAQYKNFPAINKFKDAENLELTICSK